jgi:hypothetical protein
MKHALLILAGILWVSAVQAQSKDRDVVASGGVYATNSMAQLSFTIGETAIQYLSASGASLSQGFQQGNSAGTAIHNINGIDATIHPFPNPFASAIEIKSDKILADIAFQLIDVYGKIIPMKSVEERSGKYWRLQTNELPPGNYWLNITAGGKQSRFPLTHLAE